MALIILIFVIAIEYLAAKAFQEIAEVKGFSDSKYFWWCFLGSFIGYALVIALPDRGGVQATVDTDELPDL